MEPCGRDYGQPNPDAPRELAQLAFLIGKWRCESSVKQPDGTFKTHPAIRVGRYILDGYVIADEFRQLGPAGELMQLGETYRSYDPRKRAWVMKWLDALASTWLDLGPHNLGGIHVSATQIAFKHHLPPGLPPGLFPRDTVFRNSFSNISNDHFTWRAETSTDGGQNWTTVQVIENYRIKD